MTIDGLIDAIAPLDRPQELDPDYFGHCPCFEAQYVINGKLLTINGRCWRVSSGPQGQQDLHVWGDFPTADLERLGLALKAKLDAQEWYGPYTVILEAPEWATP
jgi:hypothetical protein